ncbi:MAG TPA: hypothetical protein VFU31_21095 [Candidatus Binatia bacterium]|nr:hypothetical protein [Candidatus Binatia bacterium]
MAFPIPSWISVSPAQFQQAYESGARTGLSLAEMRDRMAAREQQRRLAEQEMIARSSERAADREARRQEQETEADIARERIASTERISMQRQNALDDWRDAQLDLREAGLRLQGGNLELARERAETAAKMGDQRAANALVQLDLQKERLELARERLEDARNKPPKEPTVRVDVDSFGKPTVSRSGPASLMEQYLPKPEPTPEPEPETPSLPLMQRMRNFWLGAPEEVPQNVNVGAIRGPTTPGASAGLDIVYESEDDARANGKRAGDIVRLRGVGRVRLK